MSKLISEREAMEIFGTDLVKGYFEEIEKHRKQGKSVLFDRSWYEYVSLPFLYKHINPAFGTWNKFIEKYGRTNTALVLVHPGYATYSKIAKEWTKERREEYGDYEKEYLKPLKARIKKARRIGEPIIVYTPVDALRETLEIVGESGILLVPTFSGDPIVDYEVLGVSCRELLEFLKMVGIRKIELCGEWVGGCFDHVDTIISKPKYGFEVSHGIKYPIKGKYENNILIKLTEEEELQFQKFRKSFDNWIKRKYTEYLSRFGLEENSCEAIILKTVLDLVGDDYIHPVIIYKECKGFDKEEITNALNFLQDCNVLKVSKADDVLNSEIHDEFEEVLGTDIERFRIISRHASELGFPKIEEVIIPTIKCELLDQDF